MTESLLHALPHEDLFAIVARFILLLEATAHAAHLPPVAVYILAVGLSLLVGLLGYRLVRVWTAILGAYVSYYLMGSGIVLLDGSMDWHIPTAIVYAVAILTGVLAFLLALKQFTFVFYTVMGIVGFSVVLFYTDNLLLALVGAFLLALICVLLLRISVIGATSLAAATLLVGILSALFPRLALLAPCAGNWWALAIIAAVAVVFAVFQLLTTRKAKRCDENEDAGEIHTAEYL